MKKLPILIDQDGVLADFVGNLYRHFALRYQRKFLTDAEYQSLPLMSELVTYYVEDQIEDPFLKKLCVYVTEQPRFFRELEPYPEVSKWLNLLKEKAAKDGRDVFICTKPLSGNQSCHSDKVDWVRNHLGPEWVSKVIMTSDKTLVAGSVLVDDHPKVIGHLEPSWTQIYMDQSYNKHLQGPRVFGWSQQTIDQILKISNDNMFSTSGATS